MSVRGYQVAFDWSRHGIWTNTLEDVSEFVTKSRTIVVSWGRNEARSTADSEAGKFEVALFNTARQFSPENTASLIAGKVLPGTPGRLTVTHPVTGAIATLFLGPADELTVDTSSAEKTFAVTCLDGWGVPGGESLSTAVYSGQRTGYLIGVILDAIGWAGGRDLDPGATVVPYWWEEGTDAATAVKKLIDSEGPPAIAYVKGGIFYFRDRHHRMLDASSVTSQGTFTHIKPAGTGPAGDYKMTKGSFLYDHGLNNIANSVTFQVDKRIPSDTEVVWSTETPISLGANETQTIIAQANDPFIYAVAPEEDVDYLLTSGSVTVSLSRTSGQTVFITMAAGGSGAFLSTGLTLRAVPLIVANTVQVQAEDRSSVSTFGRQKWDGNVPWVNAYDAQAIANRIVAVYAQARPTVVFKFVVSPSMSAALYVRYLAMALSVNVSDRITVRNDEMGLNEEFIVERVSHEIRQLGVQHIVELSCQVVDPTQPANVFTFDVAGKGFNDGAFAVDGIDNAASVFQFDVAGHGFNQGVFGT